MPARSPWTSFYSALPDGFRITNPALMALQMRHPRRIIVAPLNGRREKILLLDKPLYLGPSTPGAEVAEYQLLRIRVRDLPGWPPTLPKSSTRPADFSWNDARLELARYRTKPPALEFKIRFKDRPYEAKWAGLPASLFRCIAATIRDAVGKKFVDISEMRLIACE